MTAHRLPHQTSSFVGRSQELREIGTLLADPACRLLTLHGVGGIGKTRLALQVAADQIPHFTHGVYFVPLAPVTSPDLIASAIASALQITPTGADSVAVQMSRVLRDRHILLLMDNFEHLVEGTKLLVEMIHAAPALKFLVTSRERLNIRDEWTFALDGLRTPDHTSAGPLDTFSAVQLFVQRARQVQPQFSLSSHAEAVRTICRRVEGMPLALELAAAWLRAMPCEQVAVQLASSLDFLATPHRDAPEKHRSLRAVFAESWKLLTRAEQVVMARLTVFQGGFDLEAAEQVAGAAPPLLASLIDKSFVRLNASGRYDLHELLRQFAAESLDDETTAMQSHFNYFLKLAEQTEAHQFGRDQIYWFDRMNVELGNLRQALSWSLSSQQPEAGIRLFAALGWFFSEQSYWNEGLHWFVQLLAANPVLSPALHAKALHSAAPLAGFLGERDRAESYLLQAEQIARQTNDRWNLAWTLSHQGLYTATDQAHAMRLLEESISLFREIQNPMGLCHTLVRRTFIANQLWDFAYIHQLLEEARSIAQTAGDKIMLGWVYCVLGDVAWRFDHDLERAKTCYAQSISIFRQTNSPNFVITVLVFQAHVERLTHNFSHAAELYEEVFRLVDARLTHDLHPVVYGEINTILLGYAAIARWQGQLNRAATLLGALSNYEISDLNETYYEVVTYLEDLNAVRAQLDEHVFEEAWAAGLAMTREEVIAFARASEAKHEHSPLHPTLNHSLTNRELEILRLIARGLSNAEIAQKLVLTVGTVKVHASNIYSKLNVSSRTQAVAEATRLRLL